MVVEVKTRRSARFAPPRDTVTAAKRRALARLAQRYLDLRHPLDPPALRFDVVEVVIPRWRRPRVAHLPDAFRDDGTG